MDLLQSQTVPEWYYGSSFSDSGIRIMVWIMRAPAILCDIIYIAYHVISVAAVHTAVCSAIFVNKVSYCPLCLAILCSKIEQWWGMLWNNSYGINFLSRRPHLHVTKLLLTRRRMLFNITLHTVFPSALLISLNIFI